MSNETVDDITKIRVHYQSVHVGHETIVGMLKLSKEKGTSLALNDGKMDDHILVKNFIDADLNLTNNKTGRTILSEAIGLGNIEVVNIWCPMSKILDKTGTGYSPTKKYGPTTRKDLHNIC